jgi:hypothetical protein
MTDEDSSTGRVRRYTPVGGPFSLSAPGGGEGRGEVGDAAAIADTHLTLPALRAGPLPLPPEGPEGRRGAFVAGRIRIVGS